MDGGVGSVGGLWKTERVNARRYDAKAIGSAVAH